MKQYKTWQRILVSLTPFAGNIPKLSKVLFGEGWGNGAYSDFGKKERMFWRWHLVWDTTLFCILCVFIYIFIKGVYDTKSFDFRKWEYLRGLKQKQCQAERSIFEQKIVRKSFNRLDLDKSGFVDESEFVVFLDSLALKYFDKYTPYNNLDPYDKFNNWLDLNEKCVDLKHRKEE